MIVTGGLDDSLGCITAQRYLNCLVVHTSFHGDSKMTRVRNGLAAMLAVSVTALASAQRDEQRHVISPSQLAVEVAEHAGVEDRERTEVRQVLARPEVQHVATAFGLDLDRIMNRVDTLTGQELDRAAETARQVNERLVGGASTITISTTTIIIVLLVLILLIVALK
jgi:hypothetical protein